MKGKQEALVLGLVRGGVYHVDPDARKAQLAEAYLIESQGSGGAGCAVFEYGGDGGMDRGRVYRFLLSVGDTAWAHTPTRWYIVRGYEGAHLRAVQVTRDEGHARMLAAQWAVSDPDRSALVLAGTVVIDPDDPPVFEVVWYAGPDSD